MKVTLTTEAENKITSAKPHDLANGVATFQYSYTANTEEHYHRSSEKVTVSFSKSKTIPSNEGWSLRWIDRKMVPKEYITKVGTIDMLIFPLNTASSPTEAHIHFVENKFIITYK